MKKSIIELEQERFEWSLKNFPEATAHSSLLKLKEETIEIEEHLIKWKEQGWLDLKIADEYADGLMCLFDSAGRAGLTPQDIFDAFELKLKINKERKWIKNPDNTYSHVKIEENDI